MRNEASVARNLGVLTAAQVVTMLLNLAALVYSRNLLGPYWFGALQFGVAFSAYALVVAEWGLATLGVREVSRLETAVAVRRYAGEQLGLMALLGCITLALGAAVLPLFPIYRTDPVIFLVYLATVVPMVLSFDWVGIGLERLPWVSIAKTVRSLVYAVAVLALLRAWDGFAGWAAPRWVPAFFLAGFLVLGGADGLARARVAGRLGVAALARARRGGAAPWRHGGDRRRRAHHARFC